MVKITHFIKTNTGISVFGLFFIVMSIYFWYTDPARDFNNTFNDTFNYTNPENDYPYLTVRRNILFTEVVNTANENIVVQWYLWYDGDIAGDGHSEPMNAFQVKDYEEQMKRWANDKCYLISKSKAK